MNRQQGETMTQTLVTGRKPARPPLAWRGEDFGPRATWQFTLTPAHLEEIDRAVTVLSLRGLALSAIGKDDFQIPSLGRELAAMDTVLHSGRGFVLITGIDVSRYPEDTLRQIFMGIGAHLGVSVSQSHRGDYLGDVFDRREPGNERPYRRGGLISMHRDPPDIVGLFCLRNAKRGGLSRIASSATVWNTFLAERPDLLAPLVEGLAFYRPTADRGDSPALSPRLPVFTTDADGQLHCNFIPELIRSGAQQDGGSLHPVVGEALAFFEGVTAREGLYLDMEFQPGDMQFLNNRTIIHGRTDYEDWPEPERRRHLFRLWLMCPHWPQPSTRVTVFDNTDRAGGGIAKAA
jgi:hypothetical protein